MCDCKDTAPSQGRRWKGEPVWSNENIRWCLFTYQMSRKDVTKKEFKRAGTLLIILQLMKIAWTDMAIQLWQWGLWRYFHWAVVKRMSHLTICVLWVSLCQHFFFHTCSIFKFKLYVSCISYNMQFIGTAGAKHQMGPPKQWPVLGHHTCKSCLLMCIHLETLSIREFSRVVLSGTARVLHTTKTTACISARFTTI